MRLTRAFQHTAVLFSKANTFIYEFDFRRVKVAAGQPAGGSRARFRRWQRRSASAAPA